MSGRGCQLVDNGLTTLEAYPTRKIRRFRRRIQRIETVEVSRMNTRQSRTFLRRSVAGAQGTRTPSGNAVKHLCPAFCEVLAAGRKPSGPSSFPKHRRACALPLKSASPRYPSGLWARCLLLAVLSTLGAVGVTAEELPPVESVDAATRSMWLIDGVVVDSVSSQPISDFTVTPGSLSTDETGRSTVRWRDNLKREMTAGRLRWPRTSGFSVMRFRVTADGYRPAVTQRIWRGGPHTQIKVRLVPVDEAAETAPGQLAP
ncbi:hypothetical protein [Planctomycetes bacterium TBK1r]|uniref:Uncharacterized protein n=1 Tax=Stieleria magnilauensis TaxID=2527963 RepID=A0ABX5XTQ4_9BACT|nr:hypothetical protein TBK1r_21950 [Planctomycetes bacterium TBK1r]